MKNSRLLAMLLPTILMGGLLGMLVGLGLYKYGQGNQSHVLNPRSHADVKMRILGGFHYRGLLIDIDANPDGTQVILNARWRYRMGYHDGYLGYSKNKDYYSSYSYLQGYLAGQADRRLEH